MPKPREVFHRHVAIRAENLNAEQRRVALSISSETEEIHAWGTPQILLHEKSAVNLSRLRDIGSVLLNHDPTKIVGRPENIRLDEKEGKIRADIVFAPTDAGNEAMELVSGGFLRGASVGFKVNKWERVEDGKSWKSPSGRSFSGPSDIATQWDIFEFSLTPIPADSAVGVGRSATGPEPKEVRKSAMEATLREALVKRGLNPEATDEEAAEFNLRAMSEPKPDPKPKPKPEDEDDTPEELPTESSVRLSQEAENRETKRATDIAEMMSHWPQYRELLTGCIKDRVTVEQARGAVLRELQKDRPQKAVASRVEFGEDAHDKFRRSMADSLIMKAANRLPKEEDEGDTAYRARKQMARDITQRHFLDYVKLALRHYGLSDRGTDEEICTRAFSHSTSDFGDILKDAAFKRLLQAYQESPSTWRPLARVTSAQDFKTMNRPKLGNMGSLRLTPELVPMAEGSTLDINESFAISNYTMSFGISRQAIVNDDLSAFDRIPTELGNAAARTVADTFFNLLISASGVGPTMAEDGLALFATTHTSGANYIAAVGTPEVTGLGALKKLMRLQKGLVASGETAPVLNITSRYLLVPASLETVAQQTLNSTADPAKSNSITFNPFNNLTLIVEPRLDAGTNGTTAWYLVADPNQIEGAEVAFLNGNDQPTMSTIVGTKVQGVQWGVSLDFGAKFIEHRGWARTRGA